LVTEAECDGRTVLVKLEREAVMRGGGAMLDGKLELITATVEIEIGIAPAMQIAGTAEGLAGPVFAGGFSGMVDKQHGHMEAALKVAEEGEDGGDLAGMVFVDGV